VIVSRVSDATDLVVLADQAALARKTAELFVETAESATARTGRFTITLSGGTTPKLLYALLATEPYRFRLPWRQTHVFWGDERCVPPDHPDSNFGMAKVTLLSPGQWWLEGLRVDPKFQGLKIGSHLHEYMDAWWLAHGGGTLRLMTSSQRLQVHHLCDRTGYTKVAEVIGYDAPALDETLHAFEGIGPDDVQAAAQFAASHASHLSALMDSGWRFAAPDEPALLDQARQQRLFWWRGRTALFTYWEDEDDLRLGVGLLAADSQILADLLMDARRLAAAKHLVSVRWHAPAGDTVQPALKAAGFVTDWDASAYLYAKPHPGR